jgi:hypothetical protein
MLSIDARTGLEHAEILSRAWGSSIDIGESRAPDKMHRVVEFGIESVRVGSAPAD